MRHLPNKKGLDHRQDITGKLLMWGDDEFPMDKHLGCIGGCVHDRVVEVLDHGPGLPSAHKAGIEGGDATAKQGSGPTSSQGPGGDILGVDAQTRANFSAGGPESLGEVRGRDPLWPAINVSSVERGMGRGVVGSQVNHLGERCFKR